MKKTILIFLCALLLPALVVAQSISGRVSDDATGAPLAGASVVIDGTNIGSATDMNGDYEISGLRTGTYTLVVTFVGYRQVSADVSVTGASTTANFALVEAVLETTGLSVIADRAIDRVTPVAFTDVSKEKITTELGSRDLPMVLNTTPSVYATDQGGGAGDSRINVRGFNQRNTAIMINGVPVNDMENGWVYWSNWDGLGDATANIQVQRGMSAVNLATPSIGGTINIITDPTQQNSGASIKQEFGDGSFLKTSVQANTGLINNKFAVSANVVRKKGDGIIDGTWTDAWAYYLGAALNLNPKNRIELYAVGAPQQHGQNLYSQNMAVYDTQFALSQDDYDPAALESNGGDYNEAGRFFNQNWAPLSGSYSGQRWVYGKLRDHHSPNFLMERENIFHKPQVNLNWYSTLTDKVSLFTVLYYSGGRGGGTGFLGSSQVRSPFAGSGSPFGSLPWTTNWDATIDRNENNSNGSRTILRQSRNNQWTIGGIAKAEIKASEQFRATVGVDWRTAEIAHFREVYDLLGGSYFDCGPSNSRCGTSDFWGTSDFQRQRGDIVDYNFTNTVDWLGVFAQGEYSTELFSAYATAGFSQIGYTHENFFIDQGGNPLMAESGNITGYQVKGGVNYNISDQVNAYANIGVISKVPIFDNVINDRDGTLSEDPSNETFNSYEAGVNFRSDDGKFTSKLSYYYTSWKDRAYTRFVQTEDGGDGIVFLSGVNTLHSGVELEAAFQPVREFRLDAAASVGNWYHTDDVTGTYKDYSGGGANDVMYNLYIKDLKVGDAPQTQVALAASFFPVQGLRAQVTGRFYADFYSDFNALDRDDPDDRVQSWKVPDATVLDLHVSYNLPIDLGGASLQVFGHVFNLLDEIYIQDADDNSRFSSWDNDHDADDAEVRFGLPRRFNAGVRINF